MRKKFGRVQKRLEWAKIDNQVAVNKLLTLLEGVPVDRELWVDITRHLADTQSHITNAQGLLDETE